MTRQAARLAAGLAVAVGIALPFIVPEMAGVATWKILLGIAGVVLYVAGSRAEPGARGGRGTH